jgi:NRAMP (natural resistance-associated macrophage protein)-like metal ion transporter
MTEFEVESEQERTSPTRSARDYQNIFRQLGPGLIAGAADDDPSGIATYSQAGAQFGFGLLWTMLFTFPLMAVIQEISARIGRVTGQGIAGNMRSHYPRTLMYFIITSMLVANVLNLGADISAMGEAVRLLIGGPGIVYAVLLAALALVLEIFIPYTKYVKVLKWLTISLFAYVAIIFSEHVPWRAVGKATLLPHITWSKEFITTIIAVFGTTISPYLFFWQASQEVEEEEKDPNEKPLNEAPRQGLGALKRIKLDTWVGVAFSNIVSFFIILTTALTLHAHGVTDVATAADAAEALRPVAGPFAFALFAIGIIGTAMLALPVLAGSAAYGVTEMFNWKKGLEKDLSKAKEFYAIIGAAIVIGTAMNFLHVAPMKALFWSAVINGIVAVPLMAVVMSMSTNKKVMKTFVIGRGMKIVGWIATLAMFAAVVGLFLTL